LEDIMTEYESPLAGTADDDVEGHAYKGGGRGADAETDDDDVEGHAYKGGGRGADAETAEDDV
jgi:hypothetical protein